MAAVKGPVFSIDPKNIANKPDQVSLDVNKLTELFKKIQGLRDNTVATEENLFEIKRTLEYYLGLINGELGISSIAEDKKTMQDMMAGLIVSQAGNRVEQGQNGQNGMPGQTIYVYGKKKKKNTKKSKRKKMSRKKSFGYKSKPEYVVVRDLFRHWSL